MKKNLLMVCMIGVMMVCAAPVVSAREKTPLDAEGNFIANRGIFGVCYKVVTTCCKAVETVVFGRNGVRGLQDYFRVDRIFLEQKPKF